jgi:(S)-sulfolactate dehydrogenase
LSEGRLAGFGGDVLDGQPPDAQDPLLQQERAILTPHVAGLTAEANERVSSLIASKVLEALA